MRTGAYTSTDSLMQNPTVASSGIDVGTVFRLMPSASGGAWAKQVLYSFQGMPDNVFYPQEGVIFGPDGALYGTGQGGSSDWGAVFKLTPPAIAGGEWPEKLMYNFQDIPDGSGPENLIFGADVAHYEGGQPTTSHPLGCMVFGITPWTPALEGEAIAMATDASSDTGRPTNSLNVEKTRGIDLLGGPLPLSPVVIETEHPRHWLVSGVTRLPSLIFVSCLVYLMIGGVDRYLSLPESTLATANAATPLPAEVAAKPATPQAPPKSADASAGPARATPPNASVTNEAAPSPPPALSAEELSEYLTSGDMLLAAGAVEAARLFYERAAAAGDSTAALRLGKTFDPTLHNPANLDLHNPANLDFVAGDPVQAAYWYRRARDLGNAQANVLLKHVEASDIPPTVTLAHPVPADVAAPSVAATPGSPGAHTAPAGPRATPALPAVSATTTPPPGYASPTVTKGTPANAATPLPAEVAAKPPAPQAPRSTEPALTVPLVPEAPEREVVAAVVASSPAAAPAKPVPAALPTPASSTPDAPSRVAAPAPKISPNQQRLVGAEIAALLARGDSLLGVGDIASARLFYERASDAGDGRAALRLGATYDPGFLDRAHLPHLQGVAQALYWYRRARDLGESEAELWIQGLETKSGR